MDATTFGLLGVPSSVAAHWPGLERAPAAWRSAGLAEALRAAGRDVVDHGDTRVHRWRPAPGGVRPGRLHDVDRVVAVLREAREAVGRVLAAGHVPLVLGGECTVTVALLAALADAGRDVALAYVDGGQDLQLPADHPDEPIADSTGVAHLLALPGTEPALAGLGPRTPLLTADRLAFVGFGDDEEDVHGWVGDATRIHAAEVTADPSGSARRAARALAPARDGVVVHLDVDVLDFLALPAADVPAYGRGLAPAALEELLRALVAEVRVAAVALVEHNPDHGEPDGATTAALVSLVASVLAHRAG